jgi:GDPmannose 4,6-dehydratase
VAAIHAGKQDTLFMGNLEAVRDWGYAAEYVEGMWRMLQVDEPEDYVLATGTGFTVKDFLKIAFEHAGLNWEEHVVFDEKFLRPAEVDALVGDATKAKDKLGWKPTVETPDLARIMVEADMRALNCAGTAWVDRVQLPSWES